MVFSKSFGYSVRGILYLALQQEGKKYVQSEEIANALGIPRHFMGKILKGLAREGILKSNKGPSGGFALNENTLNVPLMRLVLVTRGLPDLNKCALQIKTCDKSNPCAIHDQVSAIRNEMKSMLSGIKVIDLLSKGQENLMKMIAAPANIKAEETLKSNSSEQFVTLTL